MACITKRRGRYVIDFYDQTGKRRWKTLKAGTTKAKAKQELRNIENLVSKRVYLPEKNMPLFSEVAKDWLEYKKPNLRETTWAVCGYHVNKHFSELNSLPINRVTTPVIEKWISKRQNGGQWYIGFSGKGKRIELSPGISEAEAQAEFQAMKEKVQIKAKGRKKNPLTIEDMTLEFKQMNILTIRKVLVTLGQIMAYAVRHKYIEYNPVRDAERPRSKGEERQDKIQILTPGQIPKLLEGVSDQKHRTLFMLAIMSGARQGELLGLKWSDLDLANNQVHIQRTFNHGRFFDTKSKYSRRKIDLGPKIMLELKKWKLACPPNELDLMFPNEAGGPMNYSNMVNRHFQTALNATGLPRLRFHDLRHTYASLLIEQGENIKYIQSQLGHSSPMVTLTVYAHLMKTVNQEAACRLENAIFEQSGSKMVAENEKGLRQNA